MEKLFAQLPVLPIITNPTWSNDALDNDRQTTPNAHGQNQESMVAVRANIPETQQGQALAFSIYSDHVFEQADNIDQAHEEINYAQQINPIQPGSSQKTADTLSLRHQASTEKEDSNSQPNGALKASLDQACETDSPSQPTAVTIDAVAASLEASFDLLLRRYEAVCVLVDASHEMFSPLIGLSCGFGIVIVCFVVYAMASGAMSVHELPVLTMGLFGVTEVMVLSVIIGCIVHDSVR
jgi:hypothetical protein